ncbi:hypothetical protein [Aeoliella mucimassa]|uniref:hypothetical protein n=1 Tax=Aeoliella mucimassa TaxID=2527972 RepID=UPI0018D47205|nr:hypothetical protein [Aeoliella mucimassa]
MNQIARHAGRTRGRAGVSMQDFNESRAIRAFRFEVPRQLLPLDPPSRPAMFGRLVCHTLYESWKIMVGVLLICIFLTCMFELYRREFGVHFGAILPIAILFLPGLCGAMVFRTEQRHNQYRFLAEHAGRPRLVWFTRLSIWTGYLVLVLVMTLGVFYFNLGSQVVGSLSQAIDSSGASQAMGYYGEEATELGATERFVDFLWWGMLNVLLASFTAFAAGQLISILLKSEILAAGSSMFASILVIGLASMVVCWRLPLFWIYLPIILGLLAASFARLPERLVDRNRPVHWGLVATLAIGSIALVLCSIPSIRYQQVDSAMKSACQVDLAVWPADRKQGPMGDAPQLMPAAAYYRQSLANSDKTATELRSALSELLNAGRSTEEKPDIENHVWLQESQAGIEKLVELSREPLESSRPVDADLKTIVRVIEADFERLLDNGDLDAARDRAMASIRFRVNLETDRRNSKLLEQWIAAPGQSASRLKVAAAMLAEIEQQLPKAEDRVLAAYIEAAQSYELRDPMQYSPKTVAFETAASLDRLPGEHARGEQALKVLAELALRRVRLAERLTGEATSFYVQPAFRASPPPHGELAMTLALNQTRLVESHRLASSSYLATGYWYGSDSLTSVLLQDFAAKTYLRLEQCRMALVAYRLDHGSYPESLRDLNPNYLPAGVPLEVIGGQSFGYEPNGFAAPVVVSSSNQAVWGDFVAMAGEPVIWSAGLSNFTPYENWTHFAPDSPEEDLGGYAVEFDSRGVKQVSMRVTHFTWDGYYYAGDELQLLTLPTLDASQDSEDSSSNDEDKP